MGFRLAEAYVDIEVNSRGLDSGLSLAKSKFAAAVGQMKAVASTLSSALLPLGVAGAAFAGVDFLRQGLAGASDLAETMSKVEVVFGSSSDAVRAFGDEMASTFGSSRQVMMDAAAGFGLIGKAAGMSQDEASKLAVNFGRLADDASSFYNIPLEDALLTLKSALVGESEPIRRFGVLLNETAVKSEALRLGLVKDNKELTEAGKVMARVSLIQRGMVDATGDHARTADSFSNQWREFTGRISDLAVSLGSTVLPLFNTFLRVLNPVAAALKVVADGIGTVVSAASGLTQFRAIFGGGSGSAANPGIAASLGLPLGGASAGGGAAAASNPMDEAKKTLASEKAHAQRDVILNRLRQEEAAAKKIQDIERQNAAMVKELWIQKNAEQLRSTLNTANLGQAGIEKAFRKAREDAEKNYEATFVKGLPGQGGPKQLPALDFKQQRDFIERAKSLITEKIATAIAVTEQLKQQGLGIVAGAAGALATANEASINRAERGKDFSATFLEGGRDYSRMIQSAGLNQASEEKQIAKNTDEAVLQLKAILDVLKNNARAGAAAVFAG